MSLELICGKFENIKIDKEIKLCFLDPPDNEGRAYENYDDKVNPSWYTSLLRQWLLRAKTITNGPIFFSFAEKWIPQVEKIISDFNILLVQRILWTYTFGQANIKRYTPCFRPIYWLNDSTIYPEAIKIPSDRQLKYKDKRAAIRGKLPSNIWEFSRICGTFREKRKWHVTQHPENLIKRIILGHSLPGDCVLDGFIGSGTTAYVCGEFKRDCIGVDMSQFYLTKIREEFDKKILEKNNNENR